MLPFAIDCEKTPTGAEKWVQMSYKSSTLGEKLQSQKTPPLPSSSSLHCRIGIPPFSEIDRRILLIPLQQQVRGKQGRKSFSSSDIIRSPPHTSPPHHNNIRYCGKAPTAGPAL